MKEVRVKQKKSLSRKILFIIALSLGLLSLALYLLTRPSALPPPAAVPDTSVVLYEAAEEELLSFTVKPTRGEAYTIIKHDDSYEIEGYPHYDLKLDLIAIMVENLLYFTAEDTLGTYAQDDNIRYEDFGLQNGALEITARFTSDREYTIRVGSRVPGDVPYDYGTLLNKPALYAMSITVKESFDYPVNWLHELPAVNFTPELIDAVFFESSRETILLRRVNDDIWMMEEPFSYPISMSKIDKLKDNVGTMRFAAFIDLADKADLAKYGLDNPRMKVRFDLAPSTIISYSSDMRTSAEHAVEAQQIVIEIGDLIEGIGFYCLYDDAVYQASDLSMGFMLEMDAEAYLNAYPVSAPLHSLESFSINLIEEGLYVKYHIRLVEDVLPNNELATDSYGNTLYTFSFINDLGEGASTEQVANLYNTLAAIRTTGKVYQGQIYSTAEVLLEVELQYESTTRRIKFYPYDALHAAIEVDGTILYYTDISYIDEVSKTMLNLSE